MKYLGGGCAKKAPAGMRISRGLACITIVAISSLIIFLLLVQYLQAATLYSIRDNAENGGDCASIGIWDASSKTCTLTTDIVVPADSDGIEIIGRDMVLDGNGHSLTGPGTGNGIIIINKEEVTIQNLTVRNFNYGVYLEETANDNFFSNTFENNNYAFYINYSRDNTIAGNTITGSIITGFYFDHSEYNVLKGNTISSNNGSGHAADLSNSRGNTFKFNTINNNTRGLYFNYSMENVIMSNSINNNQSAGIYFDYSQQNTVRENYISGNDYGLYGAGPGSSIYNNNFVDNAGQASLFPPGGSSFNQAAPVGGNYWSDFDTPAEGCSDGDSDNFCDSAYSAWPITDYLPWTSQSAWPDTIAPAINSVEPSGTTYNTFETVVIEYEDEGPSGIDQSGVTVTLDGQPLTGCTVTAASASCPTPELSLGPHDIGGSVPDNDGNSTPVTGSFTVAVATVSPHTGYNDNTNYCTVCHDVHEASGDYVLMREATVTAVCATCHGLFGAPAPDGTGWSSPPPEFSGTSPTASTKLAYEIDLSGMTPEEQDAVPGHSLGWMQGSEAVRESNEITGGSSTLKVMTSGQYGGPSSGVYNGEPATSFTATGGLYCASCHTPHAEFGQMIPGSKLLSSRPNHNSDMQPATNDKSFCIGCHDLRDNSGPEHNHFSGPCLVCHGDATGHTDFPHTGITRILTAEPDTLCTGCHSPGLEGLLP